MTEQPKLPLRLEVLGPPRLRDASGSVLEFSATKFHAFIVYLALQPGGVTRAELEQLFWPGSDRASHSLRQALSRLRGQFGDAVETSGDRVALASDQVYVELRLSESMNSANDADAFCAQVRGSFCEGFDFGHSRDLRAWFEALERRIMDDVSTKARLIVWDLWARERNEDADRVVAHALSVGLSRTAFMSSLGADATTQIARGTEAVTALETFVLGGEAPERSALGFVVGPTDEIRTIAAGAVGSLDTPTPIVELGHEAERRPAVIAADLIERLAQLPGGAGQNTATEALAQTLRARPDDGLGPDGVANFGRALEDALLAVLDEGPLVLFLGVHQLPAIVIEAVAFCLQGALLPGLIVVIHSPDATGMMGTATPGLIQGRRDYAQIVLGEVPEAEIGDDAAGGGGGLVEGVEVISSARFWRSPLVVAGTLALLFLGGWAWLQARSSTSLLPDFDFVVCTRPEAGSPHRLELYEASTGQLRVLPGPAMLGCPYNRLNGGDDGSFLIAVPGAWLSSGALAAGTLLHYSRPDSSSNDRGSTEWRVDSISMPGGLQVLASYEGWALAGPTRYAVRLEDPEGRSYVGRVAFDPDGTGVRLIEPLIEVNDPAGMPMGVSRDGSGVFWRNAGPRYFDAVGAAWDGPWREARTLASGSTDHLPVDWVGDTIWVEQGLTGEAEDGSLEIGYTLLGDPASFVSLTDNTWNDLELALSPDRTHLCWKNERQGHYQSNIVWLDRRTGEETELVLEGRQTGCEWAPHGRGLFFRNYRGDRIELLYLQLGADEPVQVIDEYAFNSMVGPLTATGSR